jgi:guanylate kinase
MDRFESYDYTLVNEELESCVEDLKAVIRAARRRTPRMAEAALRIVGTFPKTSQGGKAS